MEHAYITIYNGTAWVPKKAVILEKSPEGEYKIKYSFRNKIRKVTVRSKQVYFTVEAANHMASKLNGEEEWIGLKQYL